MIALLRYVFSIVYKPKSALDEWSHDAISEKGEEYWKQRLQGAPKRKIFENESVFEERLQSYWQTHFSNT